MKLNRFKINLSNRRHGLAAVLITTGLTASLFQNCSPAQFTRKPAATVLAVTPDTPKVLEDPLEFEIKPPSLNFGVLAITTPQISEVFTLKKNDARSLKFEKIFFDGVDSAFYSIDVQSVTQPCSIQKVDDHWEGTVVGEECHFKVIYKPLAAIAVKNTILKFEAKSDIKTVSLSGGREDFPIVVDPPGGGGGGNDSSAPVCFFRWGNESGWVDGMPPRNYQNNLNIQPRTVGEVGYSQSYQVGGANGKKCMIPDINSVPLEREVDANGYYTAFYKPKTWDLVIPPPPGSTTYTGTGKYHITCSSNYFGGLIGSNGYTIAPGYATYMVLSGTCE